jgi:hypothetical protein
MNTDHFAEILHKRLCEADQAKAAENPIATLMQIAREEARKHPFYFAEFLFGEWLRKMR